MLAIKISFDLNFYQLSTLKQLLTFFPPLLQKSSLPSTFPLSLHPLPRPNLLFLIPDTQPLFLH